jgi:hypothetical protein
MRTFWVVGGLLNVDGRDRLLDRLLSVSFDLDRLLSVSFDPLFRFDRLFSFGFSLDRVLTPACVRRGGSRRLPAVRSVGRRHAERLARQRHGPPGHATGGVSEQARSAKPDAKRQQDELAGHRKSYYP